MAFIFGMHRLGSSLTLPCISDPHAPPKTKKRARTGSWFGCFEPEEEVGYSWEPQSLLVESY